MNYVHRPYESGCCVYFRQLCGLTLVGVAVWMLINPEITTIINVSVDASNSHLLRVATILLIAVGALLFIISLLGIIGAIIENKVVLGIVRITSFFDDRFHVQIILNSYVGQLKSLVLEQSLLI